MTIDRRRTLQLAAAALLAPGAARAADYPSRPVRLVVGFPPGSTSDVFARLLGDWLSARLGQPIVVDNRPGAGGNIATLDVVRTAPDGHTLLSMATPNAINASIYEKLDFDFIRDIAPVAGICASPLVMVVNPSFPATTVGAFIAYAKANPGKISYASAGIGTPLHIAGEMFKLAAGIEMTHVAYRGGPPAQTDLLGGQVQVMFDPIPEAIKFVKSGNFRALAVTSAKRTDALPTVPAVAEVLPGYEAIAWYGIGAPGGVSPLIIDTLNAAINSALADPVFKARFAELSVTPMVLSPAELRAFVAADTARWGRVVKIAGIRAE